MSLYDSVADLRLNIDEYELDPNRRDTSAGSRTTTVFSLHGEAETGRGEDVAYTEADHRALLEVSNSHEFPFSGEYTFAEFSERIDGIELFPEGEPSRDSYRHYRRWAIESAALDLALKQSETNLAEVFDRDYSPVRFVASMRLEPPTFDRIATWLDFNSDLEFKLDPTVEWTSELLDSLAATDAVRIFDLKGQYTEGPVARPANPDLYERILKSFPDALIEDPALADETRPLFDGDEDRITWDHPITGVASIEELPFEPQWLNIKPSRFGTVENLLDAIEYCIGHDIRMYGGGQTELGIGRQQIHAFASLFYPDGPNDIAPRAYNDPDPTPGLPESPLAPPPVARGLEWKQASEVPSTD